MNRWLKWKARMAACASLYSGAGVNEGARRSILFSVEQVMQARHAVVRDARREALSLPRWVWRCVWVAAGGGVHWGRGRVCGSLWTGSEPAGVTLAVRAFTKKSSNVVDTDRAKVALVNRALWREWPGNNIFFSLAV
ncbi:hypothetical protein B0H34DRAFT_680196 [Crassisporium funariophilum]|nr:hypothetical protein B0H34DRAFT_680196 [Crassisporium funariophilum]